MAWVEVGVGVVAPIAAEEAEKTQGGKNPNVESQKPKTLRPLGTGLVGPRKQPVAVVVEKHVEEGEAEAEAVNMCRMGLVRATPLMELFQNNTRWFSPPALVAQQG